MLCVEITIFPTHRSLCISHRHDSHALAACNASSCTATPQDGSGCSPCISRMLARASACDNADNALLVAYFKDGGHSHSDGLPGNMRLPKEVACSVHPGHPVQVHCPCPRVACRPAWHAPSKTYAAVHCPHEYGGQPRVMAFVGTWGPSNTSMAALTRTALPRSAVLVRVSLADLHGTQQAFPCSSWLALMHLKRTCSHCHSFISDSLKVRMMLCTADQKQGMWAGKGGTLTH